MFLLSLAHSGNVDCLSATGITAPPTQIPIPQRFFLVRLKQWAPHSQGPWRILGDEIQSFKANPEYDVKTPWGYGQTNENVHNEEETERYES